MGWMRLGHVWGPDGSRSWAKTHAALPVPIAIGDHLYRVFFSTRDAQNRSSIGWVDLDMAPVEQGSLPHVVGEASEPILSAASPGHFDDSGLGLGSFVSDDKTTLLYYMGWNLGVLAPWRNAIGVAVGNPTDPAFRRMFAGPIMDRSPEDPYTLSYPWVLRLGPHDWRMWYGSNIAWGAGSADMQHLVKSARSRDGLRWERDIAPAIGFSEPGEYAIARPCVLHQDGTFRMWFATRGDFYRIGAAVSADGETWVRCDEEWGLLPTSAGWDDAMVCYPCAFHYRGKLYLLYNGNGYGREGFGLAVGETS